MPRLIAVTAQRYRAGARCVLRYQPRAGDAPCLYGKVVAGNESTDLATVVSSLGDIVAPYVGVVPDWQLVVQRDAGHESLRAVTLDRDPGDITTIEDEGSVDEARQAWERMKGELRR